MADQKIMWHSFHMSNFGVFLDTNFYNVYLSQAFAMYTIWCSSTVSALPLEKEEGETDLCSGKWG